MSQTARTRGATAVAKAVKAATVPKMVKKVAPPSEAGGEKPEVGHPTRQHTKVRRDPCHSLCSFTNCLPVLQPR